MPYEYFAKVSRVIDGDTIEVTLDLGFSILLGPKSLRLAGLNAPELRDSDPLIKERAREVMAFVAQRLLPGRTSGPAVKVETEKPSADDKYGRLLGTVWYEAPPPPKKRGKPAPARQWINLNLELIDSELCKPYNGQGLKPV